MLGRLIAWLTVRALRSKRLTGDDKARVTASLLDNLMAVPISEVIMSGQDGIRISGRKLEPERASALLQSFMALRDNPARKLVNDQITFEAIKLGVHSGMNQDQIIFSKASLWNIQEENRLLEMIIPSDLQRD